QPPISPGRRRRPRPLTGVPQRAPAAPCTTGGSRRPPRRPPFPRSGAGVHAPPGRLRPASAPPPGIGRQRSAPPPSPGPAPDGGAAASRALVARKVGVVLFVIIVGVSFIRPSNWTDIPVAERKQPEELVIPGLADDHAKAEEKLLAAAREWVEEFGEEKVASV